MSTEKVLAALREMTVADPVTMQYYIQVLGPIPEDDVALALWLHKASGLSPGG